MGSKGHRRGDTGRDQLGLFLIRLWVDETVELASCPALVSGDGHPDRDACGKRSAGWQGRLLHVLSGEGRNFSSWEELSNLLQETVCAPEPTATRILDSSSR
jgi:hypothetical protein